MENFGSKSELVFELGLGAASARLLLEASV
jgi:hypothetical protein